MTDMPLRLFSVSDPVVLRVGCDRNHPMDSTAPDGPPWNVHKVKDITEAKKPSSSLRPREWELSISESLYLVELGVT